MEAVESDVVRVRVEKRMEYSWKAILGCMSAATLAIPYRGTRGVIANGISFVKP
jgi:hypothetical protein